MRSVRLVIFFFFFFFLSAGSIPLFGDWMCECLWFISSVRLQFSPPSEVTCGMYQQQLLDSAPLPWLHFSYCCCLVHPLRFYL